MENQPVQRNATGSAQGTDYQIKLLLHCLLSLSKNEGAQFTLDTELKGLGNWDDIVYKHTGQNGLTDLIMPEEEYSPLKGKSTQ
jgi:hypothetical protein